LVLTSLTLNGITTADVRYLCSSWAFCFLLQWHQPVNLYH